MRYYVHILGLVLVYTFMCDETFNTCMYLWESKEYDYIIINLPQARFLDIYFILIHENLNTGHKH